MKTPESEDDVPGLSIAALPLSTVLPRIVEGTHPSHMQAVRLLTQLLCYSCHSNSHCFWCCYYYCYCCCWLCYPESMQNKGQYQLVIMHFS